MASPRRVVLLARVSTADKGQTTDSQLLALREAAARHGWTIVEEIPLKVSAWDDKAAAEVRRRALEPIRAGRADTLAVWALDRLTRQGIAEALGLLNELEAHLGAAFFSLREPFLSTATADPSTRSLLLALLAWVAEQESERRSQRVRAKVQSSRASAAKLGKRARWAAGSMPSEEEREAVRRAHGRGESIRSIAESTGIPRSTVHRIVHEPAA